MNFKYAKLFAVGLLSVAMVACDDDDDYTPGPKMDGFYFAEQPTEYVNLSLEDSSFSFSVSRNNSDGTATANLEIEADPVFNIPSTVSFAAGQSTVEVPVTFDASKLALADYYINIAIPEKEAFIYSNTTLSLKVGLKDELRWSSIGTGLYTDYYLRPFGVDPEAWEVEVMAHASTPGLYKVVDVYSPYGGVGSIVINCADPTGAYIEQQTIDLTAAGIGPMDVYSYAAYYLDRGNSLSAIKNAGYCGTLADGVITFPAETLLLGYNSKLYIANLVEANVLVLPDAYTPDPTPAALARPAKRALSKPAFESLVPASL